MNIKCMDIFLKLQNQVVQITDKLNDEKYSAEWKEKLIRNHKPSYVKEIFMEVVEEST